MDDLKTNDVDRARAQRVATDRWVRATIAGTPGYQNGSNRTVHRSAGSRSGRLDPANPLQSIGEEIADALADGWKVFGLDCLPTRGGGSEMPFRIGLQNQASDLDHAAVVVLSGDLPRPGTNAVLSSVDSREYKIVAYVPHHADKGWPHHSSMPLDVAASCLARADAPPHVGDPVPSMDTWNDIPLSMPFDEKGEPVERVH